MKETLESGMKVLLNFLGRGGWGEAKTKDPEEAKFKIDWYDTYCKLLQNKINSLDECINSLQISSPENNLKKNQWILEKYEAEKELLAKSYYKNNYAFRVAQQAQYKKVLGAEAATQMEKLCEAAQQLLIHKSKEMDAKERLQVLGLINRKEQGFKTEDERNQCYGDLIDTMQKITVRLQMGAVEPQIVQPVIKEWNPPKAEKIDLSK
jgi:hypothetical protein